MKRPYALLFVMIATTLAGQQPGLTYAWRDGAPRPEQAGVPDPRALAAFGIEGFGIAIGEATYGAGGRYVFPPQIPEPSRTPSGPTPSATLTATHTPTQTETAAPTATPTPPNTPTPTTGDPSRVEVEHFGLQ